MGAILSLPEARKAINDTGSADDVELAGVLAAAEKMVIERCGAVQPTVIAAEDHRDVGGLLVLHRWPVLSVQTVTRYPGGGLVAADDVLTGTLGYVQHDDGTLEYDFHARVVRVAYTCGRTTVPDDLRHGTEQLFAHLWRASQNRTGLGQRAVFGGSNPTQDAPFPAGFAIPHRVAELLDSEMRPPVIA